MSPKIKFSKADILDVAIDMVKKEGISSISARRIAHQLGCSVAPIYVNYSSIDELITDVINQIFLDTKQFTESAKGINYFEKMGYASFQFARQYPTLFRELVLEPNPYMASYDKIEQPLLDYMQTDSTTQHLTRHQLRLLLFSMRVFQLGLSAMIANDMIPSWLSIEDAERMIIEHGYQLIEQFEGEKA
jgi:AcrR family transcriptional regulator